MADWNPWLQGLWFSHPPYPSIWAIYSASLRQSGTCGVWVPSDSPGTAPEATFSHAQSQLPILRELGGFGLTFLLFASISAFSFIWVVLLWFCELGFHVAEDGFELL